MNDDTVINQKAALGSTTTQIAVQNNYNGFTPQEASQLAIQLFLDNFPKLQQLAQETAQKRAEELCSSVFRVLEEKETNNYSAFKTPDMQYIFYEAQKGYARFGNQETLDFLSDIVANRVTYDDNQYIKIILDKAIEIAPQLTKEGLNYLSLIFLVKHTLFFKEKDKNTLREKIEYISKILPFPSTIRNQTSFLITLGCLMIHLGTIEAKLSSICNIPEKEISEMLPEHFKLLPADYGLSPIGIALAISNLEKPLKVSINLEIWIHI